MNFHGKSPQKGLDLEVYFIVYTLNVEQPGVKREMTEGFPDRERRRSVLASSSLSLLCVCPIHGVSHPFVEKERNTMELETMISETQEVSQRFHAIIGPWDGSLLVTHLAAVVGRLADDVMTIEGKLALPGEHVHFARNIADALLQLIRISNAYHIDLERAWTALLEEARGSLSNEALVNTMRDTIRRNQERRHHG
jgi:hypothetical protein